MPTAETGTGAWSVAGAVLAVLAAGVVVRAAVSVGPYSGWDSPPRWGDYEAQRHWMELTQVLGPTEWYRNSSRNDLDYWGLDYPPLQAYHAKAFGWLAAALEPSMVAETVSRGYASASSKALMRGSALVSDVLFFALPALAALPIALRLGVVRSRAALLAALWALWLQPGHILIDHGHFQYNCVALGLVLAAINSWCAGAPAVAAAAFIGAVYFKHMALYFALPVFFAVVGMALAARSWGGTFRFIALNASVVLVATAVVWLPWLLPTADGTMPWDADSPLAAALSRLFPWQRGLFEDKVASAWCVFDPILRIKTKWSMAGQRTLTMGVTLAATLPSSVMAAMVLARGGVAPGGTLSPAGRSALTLSLAAGGLAFFLFSYHVHEKSILFPMLPLSLLAPAAPLEIMWLSVAAVFSMFHLLVRDGLAVTYLGVVLIFCMGMVVLTGGRARFGLWSAGAMAVSAAGMVMLHAADAFVAPPAALPYLWAHAFAVWSFAHFAAAWLVCNVSLFGAVRARATTHAKTD
ncbi:dolichyl glycosyltransferase [Thecamonas trahens ATCC 50062]|uniref:Alpha-1,3-glucosyltransferase n=1 Tax=Thecamonas trahens ATCC 50062 TaxID=461836 RepID=A0A0L0D4Y5_THETB|nr:dolichyl glycosyltransferase [Thecamonas trahens ATCC 50062]KNC47394.1 dolichyl glycosyltransferase [Thecamonas trahens ATCC 50062]|eukprot:XP_013759732.1 dolichyl glycosyltransferase [Thecamonas trahens ATCC 50062]